MRKTLGAAMLLTVVGMASNGTPSPSEPAAPGAVDKAAAVSTSAWTARTRDRIVRDALKVAPPALAHLILKHPDALREGLAEAGLTEGSAQHRQDSDATVEGTASAIEAVSRKAIAAFDDHRPIADAVFYLGVLAHLAADASDPLLTSPGGATAPFASDFPMYVERNVDRFPAVFYGYQPPGEEAASATIATAKQAREYFEHLSRAYAASGGSSARFDVRSIPFGVASICYSRAVTSTARAWLHVWREAHGDLGGTPHLPEGERVEVLLHPQAPAATATAPPATGEAGEPAVEAAGDAPITKVILGKSRKRLGKGAKDPNAPSGEEHESGTAPQADPNDRE